MEDSRNRVLAPKLLASVAQDASQILFPFAVANASGPAAEIATRLLYIADDLSTQELYQLPYDAGKLCLWALQDLFEICKWPTLSTPKARAHLISKSPQDLRDSLVQLFQSVDLRQRAQASIGRFCREKPDKIRPFQARFIKLSNSLMKNAQSLHGSNFETHEDSYLTPLARDTFPNEVHKLLFDGVKSHSSCVQQIHVTPVFKDTRDDGWHRTRLCLNSGFLLDNQSALFNIITATSNMDYWQEMAINISVRRSNCSAKGQGKLPPDDSVNGMDYDLSRSLPIRHGDVCTRLENRNYARIYLDLDRDCHLYERPDPEELQHVISGCGIPLSHLLTMSELTVEHKIKLSYAISRAFWQFYQTELMETRWTSEDILFMPVDESILPSGGVPLRAFVSFPFGAEHNESPSEFYDKDQYTHRYPRILFLGIVLLEIGLGQPLGLENDPKLSPVGLTNKAHIRAKLKLKQLKKEQWDGFHWKEYFVEAVENCLDSANFKASSKRGKSRHQGDVNLDESAKGMLVSARRDAVYRKVVAPLHWLAKVGFEDSEEVPFIPTRQKPRQEPKSSNNEELRRSWSEMRAHPSFHSGGSINTEVFLDDLQILAGHITRCRRLAKVTKPIRVAILDTGCDANLPFFQLPQRSSRLKGWMDFAAPGSTSEVDTFGHGTFMTRLLLHVAPIVDVYLIRVAENIKDLENNEENIARAIEYSGLDPECKADIISMSFGFPNRPGTSHNAISNAIDKVIEGRGDSVLLLASAGNSWGRRRDFPASHKDVIPIYAADSKGAFLLSNPAHTGKGPKKLGTYGTDIPAPITQEIQDRFPKVDLSAGTSIATAIAAGIVAMTLSYTAALPSLLKFGGSEEVCAKLCTKKGMEQMLLAMSLTTGYRQHFINPIWFWGEKQKDIQVFVAMCSAVEEMNKEA
ncbi:hypothetical protein JX266_010869 [Neoarthrinium moseri]|nr:hypothetical protein JX266_010869 [Neoarthrinium moseri]